MSEAEGTPLLTIRVSRDGGKTYETTAVVHSGDKLSPLEVSTWPPCRCPLHRTEREREEAKAAEMLAAVRARNRWSRTRPA